MDNQQARAVLILVSTLVRENPDQAGNVVAALQQGILSALEDVQVQRGNYAGALSSLASFHCWKKPTPEIAKMTADAIRRADGEGSCAANKNILEVLDRAGGNHERM